MSIEYSSCKFEARIQKTHFLRRNELFYLYVSPDKIIINTEPYSKKPWLVFELLPTTHVKWIWENRKSKTVENNHLKAFIIETEAHARVQRREDSARRAEGHLQAHHSAV